MKGEKLNNKTTGVSPTSIDQLSHSVVAEWVESENISLRPAKKKALKNAIADSVPAFLEVSKDQALNRYIEAVKAEERRACLEAIVNIQESFPGYVSKQRLLNLCAYPDEHIKKESIN